MKKTIKILIWFIFFIFLLICVVFSFLIYDDYFIERTFNDLIKGRVRATCLVVKTKKEIVLTQELYMIDINNSLKLGHYRNKGELMNNHKAYSGILKTSNGVVFKLDIKLDEINNTKVGLHFRDLENDTYIIELPISILEKIFED